MGFNTMNILVYIDIDLFIYSFGSLMIPKRNVTCNIAFQQFNMPTWNGWYFSMF